MRVETSDGDSGCVLMMNFVIFVKEGLMECPVSTEEEQIFEEVHNDHLGHNFIEKGRYSGDIHVDVKIKAQRCQKQARSHNQDKERH